MKTLKTHIIFDFLEEPWGGANQFLKALKSNFEKLRIYESNPSRADCFIFNSHHNIKKILKLKLKNPNKIFIHRIDGPLYIVRNKNYEIDLKIYKLNNLIADGTIFQSEWSKLKNYSLGFKKSTIETVIMNAADNSIFFYNNNDLRNSKKKKFRLVANSFSRNFNKGFDLYQYLDRNLDFNQYSMIFIGSTPISFKNIKHIELIKPNELAKILRKSDIYITGSKNDPCSNSLIEALTCGLPSVVLNDGGHPEILKYGGETFNTFEESIIKIQLIKENYKNYQKKIQAPNINTISERYINFIQRIFILKKLKKYKSKKFRKIDYYRFKFKYNLFKNERRRIINGSYRIISAFMIQILKNYKKKTRKYFILMRLISSKKK